MTSKRMHPTLIWVLSTQYAGPAASNSGTKSLLFDLVNNVDILLVVAPINSFGHVAMGQRFKVSSENEEARASC